MAHVLVVEDDRDIQLQLRGLLEEHGHSVAVAGNGLEALQQLVAMRQPPALIMLDLMMPLVDGWTVLKELRGNAFFASVPILVVTAFSHEGLRPKADAVLGKPYAPDQLLDLVQTLTERGAPGLPG